MIWIGIDTGVTTGFSVYCDEKKELLEIKSGTLIEMYKELMIWYNSDQEIRLRIEDARKRKWYGARSHAKLQGAGSIKRDCQIWEEICEFHDLNYEMVHPIKGGTKLNAQTFNQITGWEGQTNEHKRDSAMLVFRM